MFNICSLKTSLSLSRDTRIKINSWKLSYYAAIDLKEKQGQPRDTRWNISFREWRPGLPVGKFWTAVYYRDIFDSLGPVWRSYRSRKCTFYDFELVSQFLSASLPFPRFSTQKSLPVFHFEYIRLNLEGNYDRRNFIISIELCKILFLSESK